MNAPVSHENALKLTDAIVADAIRRHLLRALRESDPGFDAPLTDASSFDALGLDSMARVGLVQALETEYGLTLEPGLAFDFVTVGALAQYVRAKANGEAIDEKTLLGI